MARIRSLGVLAALLLGCCIEPMSAARAAVPAASPSWSIVASPNPAGPPNGNLAGVSCPSATVCFAVGNYDQTRGLIERRNGSTWTIQIVTDPAGAYSADLTDVSCTSTTFCVAVGFGGTQQDIQVWHGSSWALAPAAASLHGQVAGVSCASTTFCVAVGGTDDGSTLIEKYASGTWSVMTSPTPSTGGSLADVKCNSTSDCTAVGTQISGDGTLIEHWNGSAWSIVTSPNPQDSTQAQLSGVTCTASSSCTAVGAANGTGTLVEHWNGSAWSIVSSPNPANDVAAVLRSVACTSVASCVAVGSSSAGTLTEQWDGLLWTVRSSPNPANSSGAELDGVACTAPSACTAIGVATDVKSDVPKPLLESSKGSSWALGTIPTPTGGSSSRLSQVSCASASNCFAVGSYETLSYGGGLAEHWSGSAWSIEKTARLPYDTARSLDGITCRATTSCVAVGSDYGIDATTAVTARWNGSSWSDQQNPTIANAADYGLHDVACASATSCTAVGYQADGATGNDNTLAEQWNGTAWKVLSMPALPVPSNNAALQGIACVSATNCIAVGHMADAVVIEQLKGTTWTLMHTPALPTTAKQAELAGVSCTSATSCVAVGHYQTVPPNSVVLVERWNGTAWSIQSTPSVKNATAAALNDVACASSTSCEAVGSTVVAGKVAPFALHSSGASWTIETTRAPAGGGVLSSISCPTTTTCVAVGTSVNNRTLVERRH